MNRSRQGFTLIEVVLVCAVMMGLCAIGFSVGARVKEQGRRQVCTSNFRQIGLSLQMYAQDYESGNAAPALPGALADLYPRYITDNRLFLCPNVAHDASDTGNDIPVDYGYQYVTPDVSGPGDPPEVLFENLYKKRGGRVPLVFDDHHYTDPSGFSPDLVLRLDGSVQIVHNHSGNSWEL